MTTIEITGAAVAAVIGAGAYLKWAVRPVVAAYRFGRVAQQLIARHQD